MIESGQAALFEAGEDYESSTTGGMVALILEVANTIRSATG
jgi:hypothetical protein